MNWFCNNFIGFTVLILAKLLLFVSKEFRKTYNHITQTLDNSSPQKMPCLFTQGVILMEDKRFYKHCGFDSYSIVRSCVNNILHTTIQGASTIEQQLIRTLTNDRTIRYKRKIVEIALSTLISTKFGKDHLLNCYLAMYKFNHIIGVFKLCQIENYDIENLTIYDATELVARFKYPHVSTTNYIRYLKRVRTTQIKMKYKISEIVQD